MKNFMKNVIIIVILLIIVCSIFFAVNTHINPKVAVLCYHNLATADEMENYPDEKDWTIDIENFRDQLEYLKKHNYKTLTMDEFIKWKKGEINVPYKSVLITFDDGFLSNYEYAIPLLNEYNMNATIFIVGSFIENSTETAWTGNLKTYMNTDMIQDILQNYHNITLCSHTYNLHYQGAINQDVSVLENDFANFETIIPNNTVLCYPFGQYNSNIEDVLKEYDYDIAFRYGPNRQDYKKASRNDDNYEIPRLNASHGMSIWKFALRLML